MRKILPIPRSVDMVSFNPHLSGSFHMLFFFFPACHVQLCSPAPHHTGSPDTGELGILEAHSVCWHPVLSDGTALGRYFECLIKERKAKVSLNWAEHWKDHYGPCQPQQEGRTPPENTPCVLPLCFQQARSEKSTSLRQTFSSISALKKEKSPLHPNLIHQCMIISPF